MSALKGIIKSIQDESEEWSRFKAGEISYQDIKDTDLIQKLRLYTNELSELNSILKGLPQSEEPVAGEGEKPGIQKIEKPVTHSKGKRIFKLKDGTEIEVE